MLTIIAAIDHYRNIRASRGLIMIDSRYIFIGHFVNGTLCWLVAHGLSRKLRCLVNEAFRGSLLTQVPSCLRFARNIGHDRYDQANENVRRTKIMEILMRFMSRVSKFTLGQLKMATYQCRFLKLRKIIVALAKQRRSYSPTNTNYLNKFPLEISCLMIEIYPRYLNIVLHFFCELLTEFFNTTFSIYVYDTF